MSFTEEVDSIAEEGEKILEEYNEMLRQKAEPAFRRLFDKYFEAHPEVVALSFTAYTDYFNDGDTCYYHVHSVDFQVRPGVMTPKWKRVSKGTETYKPGWSQEEITREIWEDVQDGEEELDPEEWHDSNCHDLEEKLELDKLNSALDKLEDMIQSVYGDHKQFTIDRDGIEVEEYTSHD